MIQKHLNKVQIVIHVYMLHPTFTIPTNSLIYSFL